MLGPDIMKRVNWPGYLRKRRWTRLEVTIWLIALAFTIVGGLLVVAQVVGHWVFPVGGAIAAALGLMRYRADTEQRKRSAHDRDE